MNINLIFKISDVKTIKLLHYTLLTVTQIQKRVL